ncbi:hypothetical protein [Saccharothrix sp. ALI-22-I]|uniref:hypothetical protein n=1 Tax=Saccharothrix sp. ALI-22-I TaxID=1933778 RepID=UPI0015C3C875|nr:hypothetical protein [Saccharothrix sp. ALI-22-I]
MGAEEGDLVTVVADEFAEPGLGAEPEVAVDFGAGLHDVEHGMRLRLGVECSTSPA